MMRIEQAHRAGVLPPLLSLCRVADSIAASAMPMATKNAQSPPGKAKKAGSQANGPEGAHVAQSTALSCLR